MRLYFKRKSKRVLPVFRKIEWEGVKCQLNFKWMCSTGKISNVFTYFMSPWKKNRISYLETPGYALWFSFRFNDSCHHIMLDFSGTRKQTSLKIDKQLNEKFLIHRVMLSLWKTSKIQNIMFPLIFAMLLLDSNLLYSLSCEEYVNLFFWIFHI